MTTFNRSDRKYNSYESRIANPSSSSSSSSSGVAANYGTTNRNNLYGSYVYNDYNYDNIYNTISSDYGVSSGGAYRPDTSAAIAAINKAASANRDVATSSYNTKRSDLLDSLRRYQDTNAKQVASQKQSYLTSRASLDTAKEQANRQSRISNASRGLGGSGLQQLAELQNDLGLQSDQSLLANANQREMDNLKTLLSNYTEDTNKGISNAYIDYQNALKSIDADTAQRIADVNYQADMVAAQNRMSQASAQGTARQTANSLYNALNSIINNEQSLTSLAGIMRNQNQKELAESYGLKKNATKSDIGKKILMDYTTRLNDLNSNYGLPTDVYNTARNNIINSLKYYGYM